MPSSPSSSSSLFDILPERPPTPPHTTSTIASGIDDALAFLDDGNEIERGMKGLPLDGSDLPVPVLDDTPSRTTEPEDRFSAAKRVGFSPHPTYHQLDQARQHSSPLRFGRATPLSRTRKPLKSILKQSASPAPLTLDEQDSKLCDFSPAVPGSFAKMLQSVIIQLGSTKQDARLDAYLALNGAMKTYDNLPDFQLMSSKMSILTGFINRDIVWKNANGALDVNIVTQAQKLTAAILFDPKLSASLDDEFRSTLFDRSIAVMEQTDISKGIYKGHLSLLAHNRFYTGTVSSHRANKLISALQHIEDKCSGNTAIATRLIVYVRLLENAPSVMLERARDWLEHAFHGMLSSIKDIRIRGIDMCTTAGRALGTSPKMSKALRDMFDTEVDEGQSYCDYLSLRMVDMIPVKEMGPYVPQIWSAVILFFRNQKMALEKWSKFKSWLLIIQKCMNSSDLTIRYQANLAWNKLVYAIMPDASTSKAMFSMLRVPISVSLCKRGNDKHSRDSHQFACDSYFNLLHYGLRPNLTYEELDNAWENYVEGVLVDMMKSRGRQTTCTALHGLLSPSTGLWNKEAVFNPMPIKPEELSRLEPRYVRSRLGKILKMFEPMLAGSMRSSEKLNSNIDLAWNALLQSVAEAGAQEVKTSVELKEAIVHLTNLFRRLWTSGKEPANGSETGNFFARYGALVTSAVKAIGHRPFAEDILTSTKDNGIEAAPTPSQRPSKHHSAPHSPLAFLFGLLYQPPVGVQSATDEPSYADLASTLLTLLTSAKSSATGQVSLISHSMQLWNGSYVTEASDEISALLWSCIADSTMTALDPESAPVESHDSQSLGQELRDVLNIQSSGLKYLAADENYYKMASHLFDIAFSASKAGAGPGGTVLGVVEPFAKLLVEADSSVTLITKLRLTTNLLHSAVWPRTRQQLDQSRKALWGVGLAPHRATVFDPFEFVYRLVADTMVSTYSSSELFDSPKNIQFFESSLDFLKACPVSLLATALRKVQVGFSLWVTDPHRRTGENEIMWRHVFETWAELLKLLRALPNKDSTVLSAVEPLLSAGFSSPHKRIVNATILFWNEEFGVLQNLDYPEKLQSVLRARLVDADIELPNFPDSNGQSLPELPEFFDTQVDMMEDDQPKYFEESEEDDGTGVPGSAPARRSESIFAPHIELLHPLALSSPARPTTRGSSHSTPRPRLRHDDSQIQFAPIDSSPIRPADESQNLTEHQKEVANRQLENAQLFPDLSSPMAHSTALPGGVSKRLNFTPGKLHVEKENLTPTGAVDANNNIMSDDIPSSPTPSSKDASSGPLNMEEEHDLPVDECQDPPSSPPQQNSEKSRGNVVSLGDQYNNGPDDTTVDMTMNPIIAERLSYANDGMSRGPLRSSDYDVDLPSDTRLPNEQLQLEEEKAASQTAAHQSIPDGSDVETPKQTPRRVSTRSANSSRRNSQQANSKIAEPANNVPSLDASHDDGLSRVQDSFVVEDAADGSEMGDVSQSSQRQTRKRKRASGTVYTTRKAKKTKSPLKYLWGMFGQSQEEEEEDDDDEDMEDEIIVASSQGASSPVSVKLEKVPTPSPLKPKAPPFSQPTSTLDEVATSGSVASRRGRGRRRKSQTPTPGVGESAAPRNLKRKLSTLSSSSQAGSDGLQNGVEEMQAPAKTRKQHENQIARSAEALQQSQTSQAHDGTPKMATVAVVPSPAPSTRRVTRSGANSQNDEQVDHETVQSTPQKEIERVIATPRTMLSRLRSVLTDLPKMVLGSQDERDVDDVLFEIRKEVHNAAARAKRS